VTGKNGNAISHMGARKRERNPRQESGEDEKKKKSIHCGKRSLVEELKYTILGSSRGNRIKRKVTKKEK